MASHCSQNCGIPSGAIVLSGGSHPNVIKIGDTCYYKAVPTECCETPGISYEACSTCEDCHAKIYLLTRCTPGSNIIISSRNTGSVNLDNYLGQVVKLARPNACFNVSEAPQCTMPNRREPVVIETTVDNCQVPECDVCENYCDFVDNDLLIIEHKISQISCYAYDEESPTDPGSPNTSASSASVHIRTMPITGLDPEDCYGEWDAWRQCESGDPVVAVYSEETCSFITPPHWSLLFNAPIDLGGACSEYSTDSASGIIDDYQSTLGSGGRVSGSSFSYNNGRWSESFPSGTHHYYSQHDECPNLTNPGVHCVYHYETLKSDCGGQGGTLWTQYINEFGGFWVDLLKYSGNNFSVQGGP